MDWIQFSIFFSGIAVLFFWSRSESRGDYLHMDYNLNAIRNETNVLRSETNAILKAIQEEMKDFHARLCVIEERKKNK